MESPVGQSGLRSTKTLDIKTVAERSNRCNDTVEEANGNDQRQMLIGLLYLGE